VELFCQERCRGFTVSFGGTPSQSRIRKMCATLFMNGGAGPEMRTSGKGGDTMTMTGASSPCIQVSMPVQKPAGRTQRNLPPRAGAIAGATTESGGIKMRSVTKTTGARSIRSVTNTELQIHLIIAKLPYVDSEQSDGLGM